MTPDPKRVEALFAAALARSPADRVGFLAEACGDDAPLRDRVERLLQAHARAGEFLQEPAGPMGNSAVLNTPTEAFDTDQSSGQDPAPSMPTQAEPHKASKHIDVSFLAPSQQPGSLGRLAHYEVQAVLGKGGFGTVFKAFDELLHRVVAIKVLAPEMAASAAARQRFLREARAAAAVRHEHVVGIHAVAREDEPLPYLVMEYINGQTLQEKLDQTGPLEVQEILRIGVQIAGGLEAAHKHGKVHRDIKPANILLENSIEHVKITDFGLARAIDDASETQSSLVAGTPMYMSPEQAEGLAHDHRSDLFSLGTVLYVMCTGRPPFRASGTMAVLKRVCEDTPRPIREINQEVPQWLADVVEKLHAKRPEERHQSAKEVADVLEKCLADIQRHGHVVRSTGDVAGAEALRSPGEPAREAVPSAGASKTQPRPRGRWRTAATMLGLAILAAAVVALQTGWFSNWMGKLAVGNRAMVVVQWRQLPGDAPYRVVLQEEPPPDAGRWFKAEIHELAGPNVRIGPTAVVQKRDERKPGRSLKGVTLARPGSYWLHIYRDDKEIHSQLVKIEGTERHDIVVRDLPGPPEAKLPPRIVEADCREIHGIDRATFDAWLAKIKEEGYVPQTLAAWNTAKMEARFAAIAVRWPDVKAWEIVTTTTVEEGQVKNEAMLESGYRPRARMMFRSGDDGVVSDLWIKTEESPGYAMFRGNRKLLNARLQSSRENGLRPIALCAVPWTQGPMFGQLYAPDEGLRWHCEPMLTRIELLRELDDRRAKGWRPECLSVYDTGGQWVYLATFIENVSAEEWSVSVDLTTDEYEKELARRKKDGYYVRQVCVREELGETRYGVLWQRKALMPQALMPQARPMKDHRSPAVAVAPFDSKKAMKHQDAWAKHLGVPVEMTNSIGMKLRLIPPGEFHMKPDLHVTITKSFRLGIYEVTIAQFRAFVDETDYKTDAERSGDGVVEHVGREKEYSPDFTWRHKDVDQGPEYPVGQLSWNDAAKFCQWLSGKEKRRYRLPTEAEWEWACRAGAMTGYHFGERSDAMDDYVWHAGNSDNRSHPVGLKKPNPWGLFDMHGNINEYCQDWMGPLGTGRVIDPRGPDSGKFRAIRSFAFVSKAFLDGTGRRGSFDGDGLMMVRRCMVAAVVCVSMIWDWCSSRVDFSKSACACSSLDACVNSGVSPASGSRSCRGPRREAAPGCGYAPRGFGYARRGCGCAPEGSTRCGRSGRRPCGAARPFPPGTSPGFAQGWPAIERGSTGPEPDWPSLLPSGRWLGVGRGP
ncbi:MAG: protein kinase [Gemmataceae bacterium]|nr:protein kinase [Gemmataceae bacterium]